MYVCLMCVCAQTGRVNVRQFLKNIGWRTMQLLALQRDFVIALGLETGTVQVRYAVSVFEHVSWAEHTKNALIVLVGRTNHSYWLSPHCIIGHAHIASPTVNLELSFEMYLFFCQCKIVVP